MTSTIQRYPSTSASDDDDNEIDCPLSGTEALAACKEFASITNTDTGLAMMLLQKNRWDLQDAISAYYHLENDKSKSACQQTESKSQKQRSFVIFFSFMKNFHSSHLKVDQVQNEKNLKKQPLHYNQKIIN